LVAKKRLEFVGLVEDLDDAILASVVQAPKVQIRTVTDDVGVLDLASWIRVGAVVDEKDPTPRCKARPHQGPEGRNRDRGT
jgi:hypothetical protein